jgi:hypothetical protein
MTASRRLGDEMIVMSAGDARLFTLNGVGAAIWEAANGTTPLQEIVDTIVCRDFDVDPSDARRDAEAFVSEMATSGILVTSSTPIGPEETGT